MIERGMNPADLKIWSQKRNDPYRGVRFACLAVGIGVGLFIGNILRSMPIGAFNRGGIVGGLTFICGGLGLLTGFFIQNSLKKGSPEKGYNDQDTEGGIIWKEQKNGEQSLSSIRRFNTYEQVWNIF